MISRKFSLSPLAVPLLFCLSLFWGQIECSGQIDFNRDVRPILSDKCFFCHGPDENTQEADLRLDSRAAAEEAIESGELLERILSDDPDLRMPPVESKLELSQKDKTTIQQWIKQGAPYQEHWAFELLPETVKVPKTKNENWAKHPLDQFVLARIEETGLKPTREAPPLRWLRRVTLDLTGLPPTINQINRFQKRLQESEQKETVYEKTVDELLRSTGFGEHLAVAWLDAARYADSYGYQSDKLNTQWPYRDWVVKAINDNLSYDQFLTWQLAGDLLDNPTREQRLATAFNRIHRLNNEGGAVFEEWRIENVADRVHTFGTAVLGLTLECCRCHDHKYDPIPMKDFYALGAFFNSIDESGVYDRTQKVPCPSILLPTAEQTRSLEQAKKAMNQAGLNWEAETSQAQERFSKWKSTEQQFNIPDLRLALGFDRKFDNSLKAIYHPSQSDRGWTTMPNLVAVQNSPIAPINQQHVADKATSDQPARLAMQLDGERGITTHGLEPFDRWTPFSVVVTLRETKRNAERSLIAHHTRGTDCGYNGWDLTITNGHLESRMYRVWPGNAIGVRTVDPIPADQWHQISATYDGSSKAHGLRLFLNGKELQTTVLRNDLKKSCNVKVDHGGEFVVGQRFRARGLDGGLIDDVRVYTRDLTDIELLFLATGKKPKPTLKYYVSAVDQPSRDAKRKLATARKQFVMAEEAMNEIPVMAEMRKPRETHVLARGQYDAPRSDKTRVTRDTFTRFNLPFPKDAPRNRLGLAQWVTHPRHPLTARVAVNRLWGNFFSAPLVRTPENFGSQGELPTHPQLLDWLARDFVDRGWDVKRFCRNVVLSATYRQDSVSSPEKLKQDPDNRLLSRGPSYRLSAEQIRDVALASSGLLNRQLGGPPVSPYQPGKDLWKESNGMSPPYQQSVGESLYRRSLYSVWKRTAPLPNMMAFDSTTREVCTVKRSRTNTPLQALVLLNDIQFVEAARSLAADTLDNKDDTKRIQICFARLTGRNPDEVESNALLKLFQDAHAYYEKDLKAANQLLSVGDLKSKDGDSAELAALAIVCQAILNLDATIWKR